MSGQPKEPLGSESNSVREAVIVYGMAECLDCGWRYDGDDAVDKADAHHEADGHRTCAKEEVEVWHR